MPMLHNPYKVVRMFEEEIANYTGAPYAIGAPLNLFKPLWIIAATAAHGVDVRAGRARNRLAARHEFRAIAPVAPAD